MSINLCNALFNQSVNHSVDYSIKTTVKWRRHTRCVGCVRQRQRQRLLSQEIGALNREKNAIIHPVTRIPGYATATAPYLARESEAV